VRESSYRGQRGPQKTPIKPDIKLRIDPDILASSRKARGDRSEETAGTGCYREVKKFEAVNLI
jgi:hypothetical protein